MYALNKKEQEISFPVKLATRDEILAVYLGGPRVQLALKVKEMGDPTKRATQDYGKKMFIQMVMVGEEEELGIIVEAWEPHVAPLVKSMRVGTAFVVAFSPVPSPPALFAPVLNWMIRLNTYARICDFPAPGEPFPDLLSYFAPPRFQRQGVVGAQPVNDIYGNAQPQNGGGYRSNAYGHRADAGYVQGHGQMPDGYFVPNAHIVPRIPDRSDMPGPSHRDDSQDAE